MQKWQHAGEKEVSSPESNLDVKRYRPKTLAIIGMGLLFFVILCAIAIALCSFRVQYAKQSILNRHRDVQQAWLDKTMNSIRSWRNELVEQARSISTSDMIRLFLVDAAELPPAEIATLSDPDSLSSENETLRSMAEQLAYLQDVLKDFTQRKAWNDARILLKDGMSLVEPPFSPPLTGAQSELARKAGAEARAAVGPIRQGENGLYMDMADPLFEVLGKEDQKVAGVLLLSLPLEKPLTNFLARTGEQSETLLPRIITRDKHTLYAVIPSGGRIRLEPLPGEVDQIEPLPFELRKALEGKSMVYSMGGILPALDWMYVIETPASEIDEIISRQTLEIYGLGILSSIGIALLAAWIWTGMVSRKHKENALHYEKLYKTINNQKMMLDGINAAFKAGMLLVDEYGRVQISNPSFRAMFHPASEIEMGTPLVECMPSKAAISLLEDMQKVKDAEKSASIELEIPTYGIDGETGTVARLYRIELFPYTETTETSGKARGCVAIFKDITEFRKKALAEKQKAENERKRQEALISGFVHAVESIDPNLYGHSRKMANVAKLLGEELQMNPDEKETLLLASQLSQIGKIFIPRELLTKQGDLTPEELQEVKRAPEYADKILNDLHFNLPVRETVSMIGERVDGSGKPLGLTAEKITLAGRALGIINALIAMTSSRAWRKGGKMSIEDAIEQLANNEGFDKDIVNALERIPKNLLEDALSADPDIGK